MGWAWYNIRVREFNTMGFLIAFVVYFVTCASLFWHKAGDQLDSWNYLLEVFTYEPFDVSG